MSREILLQLLNGKLVLEFFIILISYFAEESIIFKLNIQMLGIKVQFQKVIFPILLLISYNLFGKLI
jgi:hypothetical protein